MDGDRVVDVLGEMDLLDFRAAGPGSSRPPEDEDAWGIDWDAVDAGDGIADSDAPVAVPDRDQKGDAWARVHREVASRAQGEPPPPPDPDALAWYLPMHFYGHDWGIHIREASILDLAAHMLRNISQPWTVETVAACVRLGLTALYLHEAFHHKAESFAIRLEVVEREPVYAPYQDNVYAKVYGTDDCLEEALACADMVSRPKKEDAYGRWIRRELRRQAYDTFVASWIPTLPPGYRRGLDLADDARRNRDALNRLSAQIHEGRRQPMRRIHEWDLFREGFKGLANVREVSRVLVPLGEAPVVPWFNRPPLGLSVSTREMDKIVRGFGYELESGGGKGSHLKYVKPGCPPVILPANRKALSDGVLGSTSKLLGLRTVRELLTLR